MTRTAKAAISAGIALLASFAMMALLRAYAPQHSFPPQPVFNGTHPMTAMWAEMGWMMALGPIAMVLFFGGMLTLVVLFVRFLTKAG